MEYRQLGGSGFKVPVLTLGTGTFGGGGDLFTACGTSDVAEATRLVDICLDAGLTMFDSADVYSDGMAEEILGQAIAGRRDKVLISTKATFRSRRRAERRRLLALSSHQRRRRLRSNGWARDYIDLFQLHGFDALTPIEETLSTLDDLVRAGKIRYLGCSNFSGWHLMKSLAVSEKYGYARYVAHQAYYSLVGPRLRMGTHAARPRPESRRGRVESARLGAIDRQNPPQPAVAARRAACNPSSTSTSARRCPTNIFTRSWTRLMRSPGRPARRVPQIALNWLLQRPTVSTHHHRRAQRGTIASKFGRDWLEPGGGANCAIGCRQRDAIGLSLFSSTWFWRTQSMAGGVNLREAGDTGSGRGKCRRRQVAIEFHTGNCLSKSLWLPIQIQTQASSSNLCATAR